MNNKEHIPVGFTKVMTLSLHRARCALVNLFYGFGRLTKITKSIKLRFIRKYTHKKENRWWPMYNEKILFNGCHYYVSDILFQGCILLNGRSEKKEKHIRGFVSWLHTMVKICVNKKQKSAKFPLYFYLWINNINKAFFFLKFW